MVSIITSTSNDPYFNSATEEFLFKNYQENILFFWQNSPSVFVGKHQNALAEINFQYLHKQKIPVIRRFTGGGTVFHDMGNVNFSMIFNSPDQPFNINSFSQPIVSFLKSLGVDAIADKRNAIFVGTDKVSGTAQHIFKNRMVFHGTLLYSSNIEMLLESLKTGNNYQGKAVPSVKSKVGNLIDYIHTNYTTDEFFMLLSGNLKSFFEAKNEIILSGAEIGYIRENLQPRYKSWNWNYGYSREYSFLNKLFLKQKNVDLKIRVKNGVITDLSFFDCEERIVFPEIATLFAGEIHQYETIHGIILNNLSLFDLLNDQIDTFTYNFF